MNDNSQFIDARLPGVNHRLDTLITDNGELVIRIGIQTLAEAAEANTEGLIVGCDNSCHINDPFTWAKDVKSEMMSEREDGSSLLTDLLDSAMSKAVENGSAAVELKVRHICITCGRKNCDQYGGFLDDCNNWSCYEEKEDKT